MCPHQVPSKGCGIYSTRPSGCAAYSCLWLNGGLPLDTDRPDLLGLVVECTTQMPTVAMVSEVWAGASRSPRALSVLASIAAQLPSVVVFVLGGETQLIGRMPTEEEMREGARRFGVRTA